MPQTDPFTYNAPKKLSDAELARALRLDAAAELDAMNLYLAHVEATDNEDAQKVLAFIARDEKEHYALFVELIKRLDPEQAEEFAAAGPKLDTILQAPAGDISGMAVDSASDGAFSPATEPRESLHRPTVGSLLHNSPGT